MENNGVGSDGSGSRHGEWARGRERRAGLLGRSLGCASWAGCARSRAGQWAEQAEPAAGHSEASSLLFFFLFFFSSHLFEFKFGFGI